MSHSGMTPAQSKAYGEQHMSYLKPVTREQVENIRNETGEGMMTCQSLARKKNALEALEDCRVDASLPYSKVNHTILDLLQYLIERN